MNQVNGFGSLGGAVHPALLLMLGFWFAAIQ